MNKAVNVDVNLRGSSEATTPDKDEHLRRVVEAIGARPGVGDTIHCSGLVDDYFARFEDHEFVSRQVGDLSGMMSSHLELGEVRRPGEDLISISTPHREKDGWTARGSTVVQIITDDRSFLVDTVAMNLTQRGWSIRNLHHPQFNVLRDDDGTVVEILARGERRGLAESWISVEAYPPLGQAASDLIPELEAGLRSGLQNVRLSVDDWSEIRRRMIQSAEMLEGATTPISPHRVRGAINLLRWITDDNFVFLGYREYQVDGTEFTPVEGTGLGILRDEVGQDSGFNADFREGADGAIVITKDSRRSPVHRPGYLDYLGVRVFDEDGNHVGEHRFLGLWSATAYNESVFRIPMMADKAGQIVAMSGYDPSSHAGHAIHGAIASLPRDELFQASVETLFPIVYKVASLQERSEVRLFLRPGAYGRFLSCIIYLPRDRYDADTRDRIQRTLREELGGESMQYVATVTDSVLARLYLVVRRPDSAVDDAIDVERLEHKLTQVMRTWEDLFEDLAAEFPAEQRGIDFGEAYEATFSPRQGVLDLLLANELSEEDSMQFSVFEAEDAIDPSEMRFKVLTRRPMSVTDAMPHLSAMGVEVIDEIPFELKLRGTDVFLYDFGIKLPSGRTPDDFTLDDRRRFWDAFEASYQGWGEAGLLNRLVIDTHLTWQQVGWLRMMSRYLQQAGSQYSQRYMAAALTSNPEIATELVAAFEAKFDPVSGLSVEDRERAFEATLARIDTALDAVASLDHDRIFRLYMALMRAIIRTNVFAPGIEATAIKLRPVELEMLPEPKPEFEIFVYSPRVQGVHLRFGAVARGGLRWSDRSEDFRTEVLGLVKAQMVKNTVIVPSGAKGGFVPQRLPNPADDREAWFEEGKTCYRIFIDSMLSLTDNIVDNKVVPPAGVVAHDPDDPYLVVAADKGTATFSDLANEISLARGFWLGDAFASGGGTGYDHKGMGITARGAWESTKRHFFEMGFDCQNTEFTCVGVGDMSGDVFGNGMLLSRRIKLVAAFDHRDIFLDPDPDAEKSFVERERLFRLPRSSWADYDPRLISFGGGVYSRTAKWIPVTPQVANVLGIEPGVEELTPEDMIKAILTAPVELLWNGGIGTYVKASTEHNREVGDKGNDSVRVNGNEVLARCVVEGGNLGWTQQARIEYALHGGHINTDYIDNSAGVDTSDHEVNIKILLADEVASGRLSQEDRNALLASMTDDVAGLVLAHNIDQNLSLASATQRSVQLAEWVEDWMRTLEEEGHIDRTLESLPSTEEMRSRIIEGRGLVRPELASMLAWTKIRMSELILDSELPEDPYLSDRLVNYFPAALRERFADVIAAHPLRREIITTVTVNRFVNSQGITAYHRLGQETGADIEAIVRAQLAARSILSVAGSESRLRDASGVDATTTTDVRVELRRMVERATRWLLNHRRTKFDVRAQVDAFAEGIAQVRKLLPELLPQSLLQQAMDLKEVLIGGGLEEGFAHEIAFAQFAHLTFPVVQAARITGRPLELVAGTHFALMETLGLDAVVDAVDVLPRTTRWETMARAALRDDLQALMGLITQAALGTSDEQEADTIVAAWRHEVKRADAEAALLRQICDGESDLAKMSVALRVVRSLVTS